MVKRIILIGHGYFGSLYRERLVNHPKLNLVGIVDPDYARLRSLEGFTLGESYKKLAENVEHDGVIICTPSHLHCELSIRALKGEKHVLCMKPGSLDRTQAAMIGNAIPEDATFNVAYTMLHTPEFAFFQDAAYAYGKPESMGFYRNVAHGPKPEGAIMDLLPHDISIFLATNFFANKKLSVRCVSDVISASADIYTRADDTTPHDIAHVAHLSCGYNAPFPMKKATAWIKPSHEITNPRIQLEWNQIAKSINTLTQGGETKVFFRHDPDAITQSLNDWEWRMSYNISGFTRFNQVTRILHAMQHSASLDGRLVGVME